MDTITRLPENYNGDVTVADVVNTARMIVPQWVMEASGKTTMILVNVRKEEVDERFNQPFIEP